MILPFIHLRVLHPFSSRAVTMPEFFKELLEALPCIQVIF
jgi:hypothetical protein